MDYRKAWEAVKLKVERSLEEGEDRRFNEDSDTRESGVYEAYKRIHDHMIELESEKTPETPEVSSMEAGTLILIHCATGAAGAEHKVAVVTDEPNDWGIWRECPGYNVAVLKTGQIWRIPPNSEVDILYRPHK